MNTLVFHHDDAGWARRFAVGTSDKYVSSYVKKMDLCTQMNLFMGHSLSQDIVWYDQLMAEGQSTVKHFALNASWVYQLFSLHEKDAPLNQKNRTIFTVQKEEKNV